MFGLLLTSFLGHEWSWHHLLLLLLLRRRQQVVVRVVVAHGRGHAIHGLDFGVHVFELGAETRGQHVRVSCNLLIALGGSTGHLPLEQTIDKKSLRIAAVCLYLAVFLVFFFFFLVICLLLHR